MVVPVSGAGMPWRHRLVVAVCALVLTLAGALTLATGAARAGQWVQVSCLNEVDGSMGNAQGWVGSSQGSGLGGSLTTSSCNPLVAALYGTQSQGNREILTYTPPAGSSLTGGTVVADVNDTAPSAISYLTSPTENLDAPLAYCSSSVGCQAPTNPGTLTATLPPGGGGNVFAQADCDVANSCQVASAGTVMASISIDSAELLLENDASPAGSGFSGTALGTVSGTGQLLFTATDPSGPGVYNVTVAIDGTTVYSATPDTNNGACVQHGIYPGTSALMFDEAQPCPVTESVDVPVPYANIANGTHTLTVTVTDAAGNSATVLAQAITVANPVATPTTPTAPTPPAKLRKIDDKVIFRWDFRHPRTRLESVTLARRAKLPAKARLSVACVPAKDCPAFKPASVAAKRVTRLFASLKGKRFARGATFQLMIAAPHRKAERLLWAIHRHRSPSGRLAYGAQKLVAPKPKPSRKKRSS